MATLGYKHRLFIHHYLETTKNDEVKAARLAGFANPKMRGPRLLASPKIAAHLEQKLRESGAMSVAEILARLSAVASLDPLEFVVWNKETTRTGEEVEKASIDLKKIKKLDKGHLIKKLKINPSGATEVEFQDSVDALDKLAKYHGIFKERIEIEHINALPSSERVSLLVNILAQQPGTVGVGAFVGPDEPGQLRAIGEQRQVDAGLALDVDQPTPGLAGPEGDRPPGDHARPANGKSLSPRYANSDSVRLDDDGGIEGGGSGL